jgi:succinate-acetate transporter protein
MPTSQPSASPLGILLSVVAIYLLVKSPKKLQTLGRMAVAFVVTVLLFIVLGAILRMGDPEAQGRIGGLVGLLILVIAYWWHMRPLKRANTKTSGQPDSQPSPAMGKRVRCRAQHVQLTEAQVI